MATTNGVWGYEALEVNAPVATYGVMGGGGSGRTVISLYIKMKTHTPESAPGLGLLLLTINYWDGEAMQPLNVSLPLAAGNWTFGGAQFQDLWIDLAGDPVSGNSMDLAFTYIGGGGTDGSADVTIDLVDQ